ncbi:MAG TPA: SURF1 family protein [Gammaproteobacteria bacterium]|nr:SURF1 family protein [Gammaproteobacteria bacterium]
MMKNGSASTYIAIFGLLAFAALFAVLGTWQLRRAEASRVAVAQFAGGAAGDALTSLPLRLDDDLRFRRVEVDGEYLAQPQFLLDNMLHEGAAGYHVLTALRVHGVAERVLVNRGWVPAGPDRAVLPDVAVDEGARTVSGRLERLPRPGLRLGAEVADHGEPIVVLQYPTAAELARRLRAPVFDYELLLDAGADDGFVRDWRAPGLGPERHLSYAGQWWALGLGALAAAIVIAVKAMRRKQ